MICVFTGGDIPNPKLCRTFFENTVANGEKIKSVAADSGLQTFELFQKEYGIFELKSLLGDWDSISDKSIIEKYPKEIIENHIVDKDYTDTELALEKAHLLSESEAAKSDIEQIVLIGAGGGRRIDHLLAVFDIFSTPLRPNIWISGEQFLYFLPEKSVVEIENLNITDTVSFFRTTESRTLGKIKSEGLEWESDLFRKQGVPSISNRISKKNFEEKVPVKIEVEEKNYILAVPNSARVRITANLQPPQKSY